LTAATGNVADRLAAAVSGQAIPEVRQTDPVQQDPEQAERETATSPAANWRQDAHHDGWAVRLSTGQAGGTGSQTETVGGNDITAELSGGGSGWELMIGRAIRPDFLWFFLTSRTEIYGPDITVTGLGTSSASADSRLGITCTGLGISYYMQPKSWWGSLAVVSTTYDFLNDVTGNETTSDTAAGLYLALGKDWWLWKRFTVGLMARFVNSELVSLLGLGVSFTYDITRSR